MSGALKKRVVSKPKSKAPSVGSGSRSKAPSVGSGSRSKAPSVGSGSRFTYKSIDDKDVLAMINIVRTGISHNDFEKIYRSTPFLLSEWAIFLQISERTIQRNEKEKKPFQPIHSERIIDIAILYQYGVSVFGDKDNFNIWLTSTSVALGGRTPRELLDTRFGIGMVKDELGRIEHGILA